MLVPPRRSGKMQPIAVFQKSERRIGPGDFRLMLHLTFDQAFKLLSAIGAICTFAYTYYTWRDKSRKEFEATRADAAHAAETRRIETTKPFLDMQLVRYTDAIRVVAALASSDDESTLRDARRDFWSLYYGELALVESPEVEAAMVAIGRAKRMIGSQAGPQAEATSELSERKRLEEEKRELQPLALNLTKAIRKSLDRSWGIRAWTKPDNAADENPQIHSKLGAS